MSKTVYYIAGPMTGLPDFNFPAFHKAADMLRCQGHIAINPAELHDHTDRSWEFYMKSALSAMLYCNAVYMLAGWRKSRGARIEHQLAKDLNMWIVYEEAAL